MKINKSQFQKWIAALDSGQYTQVKNILQNKHGYCVMGVACKELIPATKLNTTNDFVQMEQSHAPKWLLEIEKDFYSKTETNITELNDMKRGYSFSEIATLLELVYVHKILD